MAEPVQPSYVVSVKNVRDLARHAGNAPYQDDPQFGPDSEAISDDTIQYWIDTVSSTVTSRVVVLAAYQRHTERWAAVLGSAQAAVLNGAAAYLVDAAFPAMATPNNEASYGAVLRARYETELQYLTDLPAAFAAQDEDGAVTDDGTVGVQPLINPTPTYLPPGLFNARPQPFPGARAPGAESPWP